MAGIPGSVGLMAEQHFQKLIAQRLFEEQQAAAVKQQHFENAIRLQGLDRDREQDARQRTADRLNLAKITADVAGSRFDPSSPYPVTLTPDEMTTLAGTPYAGLMTTREEQVSPIPGLEDAQPLPGETTTGAPAIGRTTVGELRPRTADLTARRAHIEGVEQRKGRAAYLQRPELNPMVRDVAEAEALGLDVGQIPAAAFERPESRQATTDRAFADWQRREQYRDQLMRQRAREAAGRQSRGTFTAADRARMIRQIQSDALRAYNIETMDPLTGGRTPDAPSLDDYIDQYVADQMQAIDDVVGGSPDENTPTPPSSRDAGAEPPEPPMFTSRGPTAGRRPIETPRSRAAAGAPAAPSRVPARRPREPVTVVAPNGRTYTFPTEDAANTFKRQAGIP